MAISSFAWHGVLLNDFERLDFSVATLIGTMTGVYLLLSLLLTVLCVRVELEMSRPLKGALIGGVLGFTIYLVAFTLGFSFQESPTNEHLVLDFAWQMFEQAVGGLIVGMLMPARVANSDQGFAFESLIKKNTTAA